MILRDSHEPAPDGPSDDGHPREWCIIETSPSKTIALAVALQEAGIEAWTPTETVKGEPTRIKEFEAPRPLRKPPDFVTRALLPSIVFARYVHVTQLAAMARTPAQTYQVYDKESRRMVTKGHPHFRVFRPGSPPIPDRELHALRERASRRKPRGQVHSFKVGDPIKMTEGAYGGPSRNGDRGDQQNEDQDPCSGLGARADGPILDIDRRCLTFRRKFIIRVSILNRPRCQSGLIG